MVTLEVSSMTLREGAMCELGPPRSTRRGQTRDRRSIGRVEVRHDTRVEMHGRGPSHALHPVPPICGLGQFIGGDKR